MNKIKVIGFESPPKGKLLSQFVDFDHDWGVAYERCIGYEKDFHVHDRLNLTFPRSSSIIEFKVKVKHPAKRFVIDEKSLLWMPSHVEHRQDTLSTIYDNLALFPTDEVVQEVLEGFSERYGVRRELPKETVKKTRTVLLNELLNEYFVERVLERKKPRLLLNLTRQILEETLRIVFCPRKETEIESPTLAPDGNGDPSVTRAVRFIEANLFHDLTSQTIARSAGTSPATLFRRFQQELGVTPGAYITSRRLDESLSLLKGGDYKVSDAALIVGYADLASFSKAFKARFGKAPSEYLPVRNGALPGATSKATCST